MNELLKKIYNDVLIYEKEISQKNKKVDAEIKQLIKTYDNQFNNKEMESIYDLMANITLTAEQAGFENGMKFMIKTLYFLMKD